MHPKYKIEREYLVKVFGNVSKEKMNILKKGIYINNIIYKFHKISLYSKKKKNTWFKILLLRGKNREIRKTWNAIGIAVNQIIRIKYGNIYLPKTLKIGCYKELDLYQIKSLYKLVNLVY